MKQWTQDEAIASECACDTIGHLVAIQSSEIVGEQSKPAPDTARVGQLRAECMRLASERRELHVDSHAEIARINDDYGAIIRAWHAGRQTVQSMAFSPKQWRPGKAQWQARRRAKHQPTRAAPPPGAAPRPPANHTRQRSYTSRTLQN